MRENDVRTALAFLGTFRKEAHRYLAPPEDGRPRPGVENSLRMSALQLRAALARVLADDQDL